MPRPCSSRMRRTRSASATRSPAASAPAAMPRIGQRAAEEDVEKITEALRDSDMVFITAGPWRRHGLGRGARHRGDRQGPRRPDDRRRDQAVLVRGRTPQAHRREGRRAAARRRSTRSSRSRTTGCATSSQKNTSIVDAFRVVDDVLRQGVQGISDIITVPGLINLDFADVQAIMQDAGSALMGIGRASRRQSRARGRQAGDRQPAARGQHHRGPGDSVQHRGGRPTSASTR